MGQKEKLFTILLLFVSFFYADHSSEKFTEDLENDEIVLVEPVSADSQEDFILYNLIYIESCLRGSKDLPQKIIDNFDLVQKPLKDYLFLETAKFFLKKGDYKIAESFIEKVNFSQIKDERLLYESLRLKAEIYSRLNLWNKEAIVWNGIQKIIGISDSRKKEALLKEALALKKSGSTQKATLLFEILAFDYSLNPFGSRAFYELFELNPSKVNSIPVEKKNELLRQFVKNGRSGDALILLKTIDEKKRDFSLVANALYRARLNKELFEISDSIIYKNNKPGEKEIETVLKALWATLRCNDYEKAKKYFDFVIKNSNQKSNAFKEANYAFGSFLFSDGKFEECTVFFNETIKDPQNKFYYNALFKALLSNCISKRETSIPENLLIKENPFKERTIYFARKFLGKEINYDFSKKSLYFLLEQKDLKKIVKMNSEKFNQRLFKGKINGNSFIYRLYKSKFPLFALNEAKKKKLSKDDGITIKAMLASIGDYCKEFSDINEDISLSHPMAYKEEISKAAKKYGVEESLMFAICRNESRFNPFAYSNTGAVGLFQIMPETAKKLLQRDVTEEELFDPEFNAEVAAIYLKKLQEMFLSKAMVVSSYNAGEEVVLRWKEKFYQDEVLFILMIPYFETQNYTEKVLFDKMIYDCLVKE